MLVVILSGSLSLEREQDNNNYIICCEFNYLELYNIYVTTQSTANTRHWCLVQTFWAENQFTTDQLIVTQ